MDGTVTVLVLIVMLALVVALIIFAGILRDTAHQLQDRSKNDTVTMTRLENTVDRMETATKIVAEDLGKTAEALRIASDQRFTQGETIDRMEAATKVVATDLAASVGRADATHGVPGEAADNALRTGDTAEDITDRQDSARGN